MSIGAAITASILGNEAECKRQLDRETVKMAVQTAIFCRACERVLDMRTAVLIELAPHEASVYAPADSVVIGCLCGGCADKLKPRFDALAQERTAKGRPARIVYTDGRTLYGRKKRGKA